uniref:Uncharacterized protein n=1 Tax=Chenopodium quinoa TaxID=63459 RepID=A0A803NDG9_CHEQI
MVSSATTANNVDSLVLDIEGNPLEVGSFYYVRTPQSTFRWGGGIVAASKPNQPECPQYVAQLGEGCACSQGAWQLTPDANSGDLFLSTGGGIGNPSPQTAAIGSR